MDLSVGNANFSSYTKFVRKNTEKYKPWLPSPPSLIELAGNVVNDLSMPRCWTWNIDDVVKWLITTIQLPDYRDCFVRNFIDGRRLITIDASACSRIGIRDFQHIKKITQGIRKLFHVEKDNYKRSIGLPPRYPWSHYLHYRAPSGPVRENTRATKLFLKMGIISAERLCVLNHWQTMNPIRPDFPYNRFGCQKAKYSCLHKK